MFSKYCTQTIRLLGRNSQLGYLSNSALLRFKSAEAGQNSIAVVDYDVIKKFKKTPENMLIDVREPKELQETGQIPQSINIPLNDVTQDLCLNETAFKAKFGIEKPPHNTELIFYCRAGIRSQKAAEATLGLGYTNVKNYTGSWLDWAEREGLPK